MTALRNNILMPLARQGLSVLSALWVIGNLTFWLLLLLLSFPISIMLRLVRQSVGLERWIQWIYRSAVRIDSAWMLKVVGIRLEVEGTYLKPNAPSSSPTINRGLTFPSFKKSSPLEVPG